MGETPADAFSQAELEGITELRHRLADLQDKATGEAARGCLGEDSTLWRYWLAKSEDASPLDEAEAMFRRSMQWREEIGLAALCNEWKDGGCTARSRMGHACFYAGILEKSSSRLGPVLVERLGKTDFPGLHADPCKLTLIR